ncbi:hypothetical protein V6N13_053312 [Hibiscus sabdariffa]|uniref:Uncharacterized protein n=2 Tax=Hibiscus sabdariffa TaxID=183260 RepID=A0ABR2Q6W5_9ROSI
MLSGELETILKKLSPTTRPCEATHCCCRSNGRNKSISHMLTSSLCYTYAICNPEKILTLGQHSKAFGSTHMDDSGDATTELSLMDTESHRLRLIHKATSEEET